MNEISARIAPDLDGPIWMLRKWKWKSKCEKEKKNINNDVNEKWRKRMLE